MLFKKKDKQNIFEDSSTYNILDKDKTFNTNGISLDDSDENFARQVNVTTQSINQNLSYKFLNNEKKSIIFSIVFFSIFLLFFLTFFILVFFNIFPSGIVQKIIIYLFLAILTIIYIFKIISNLLYLRNIANSKKTIKNFNENKIIFISDVFKKNKLQIIHRKWFVIYYSTFMLLLTLVFYIVSIYPGTADGTFVDTGLLMSKSFINPFNVNVTIYVILSSIVGVIGFNLFIILLKQQKINKLSTLLNIESIDSNDINFNINKLNKFYKWTYWIILSITLLAITIPLVIIWRKRKAK